jgi:hypothetical protein
LLHKAVEQPWKQSDDTNEPVMFQNYVEEILLNLDERN